ncbi:cation diffusion facilitator family transporter [Geobacillus stearothermophilus]|uniref:cation diffusion facilitator family transporter n=1 Tax=Geobacillus stearothermophilus TaxID=1422 RepID=UPI0005184FE3|nr:cation diffusion facilitator family transporter [Geobacillus stearothermophilus]KOR95310.1 cation transporter [Geobacillus stearothermophilus ATCC 12980]MED3665147.1 cation diffusion facilitator family transporter [Geobacillus stearothermophilus]MED3751926.1 cation diffusion facilitator family transporter [Geobacillus stearothermophilus]MED3754991.1 cation diffusion facilitator family transporter [Geobacillus stearothermophilus]MED3778441.1 cation diffusion facilitator family transporter [G
MAPTLYDFHHLPHVKTQHESKKALWVTLLLTMFFTAVEIIGGLISNSLALLSDSAHMASDVLALGLSMVALYMATRPPNRRFTFGFLRFEIITSFLNGLTLAVIALWILWEGIQRFLHPEPINFRLMLGIAAIGLIVNLTLTIVLSRSTKEEDNLNVQSALWHFIGDLISSIGVIVSALLIYFTGWTIFDPIISLVIAAIIFTGGAKIMRESYLILMEAVPDGFDLEQIRADIRQIEGVEDVHDMHLWAISTDHYSLSAHVFVSEHIQPLCVILAVNEMLKEKYGIEHATIQVEHAMLHDHGTYGKAFLEKKKQPQ